MHTLIGNPRFCCEHDGNWSDNVPIWSIISISKYLQVFCRRNVIFFCFFFCIIFIFCGSWNFYHRFGLSGSGIARGQILVGEFSIWGVISRQVIFSHLLYSFNVCTTNLNFGCWNTGLYIYIYIWNLVVGGLSMNCMCGFIIIIIFGMQYKK